MSEGIEKVRVWIKVANASHDRAVEFILEPWAEQYTMAPGTSFDVVAEGPPGDYVQIEWSETRIVVYGWTGSVISVYEKGRELSGATNPWPPLPSSEA